jgi:hypothetical protein
MLEFICLNSKIIQIFNYGFKKGKIKNKENLIFTGSIQKYKNYNLPISMNPMDYGRIINKTF